MTYQSPRSLPKTDALIADARDRLRAMQRADGHIVFELEADCTIPAEYVLMLHFLGERHPETETRIATYLRARQKNDGSWPLYHEGAGNISCTLKAYWALKLIGDDPDAPHMARARSWILGMGGAARANVFTRILMVLYGHIPERGAPCMPVEVMLLPRWFPFHMTKIAYWSRTVLTPLLILSARRARAQNPTGRGIAELFLVPPERQRRWQVNPTGTAIGQGFLLLDRVLHRVTPVFPRPLRRRAIAGAEDYMLRHLNGEAGLGAIFPAMINAVMALRALGYGDDSPEMDVARRAVDRLIQHRDGEIYPEPCQSPVWDSGLAAHALLEAGAPDDPALLALLDWLAARQILDHVGDWAARRPGLRPGGWAFQYDNPDFPDVDDTAVVAMAMHRADPRRYRDNIARACEWLAGMQSRNGGWGAFDPENEHAYLNAIPFADHGALLDPPSVDVTARVLGCLAQVDAARHAETIRRAVAYIRREQQPDGSWFGRWGANYVYGTWSALVALRGAGEDMRQPWIRRAVDWLKARQRPDGGWGEGLETYEDWPGHARASTPSQTAWGLLGLMAAGDDETQGEAAARAVEWLRRAPRDPQGARWQEAHFTGVGFPRVFYLKYHGYAAYFPLMALARHARLTKGNDRRDWGF